MLNIIKQKFGYMVWNIYIIVCNLFFQRDKKIILIGAWMGTKFADNSRFLYQYLCENKEKLGLKRVIWVTRNESLNTELNSLGYESYLIGSKESTYWHIKAGVHVICNMAYQQIKFSPDIDTKFSWGAKKIQLWHGVGFKAVGAASNDAKKNNANSKNNKFHGTRISSFMSQGGWHESFVLCTSDYDVWINQTCMRREDDRFFVSCYPRNCKCIRYLHTEEVIINKLKSFSGYILYLPTFRSNYENYEHPLLNNKLIELLKKNTYLWIEKPHSASDFKYDGFKSNNHIMLLDSDFDINTLYDYVSIVVSDYSSAVLDGIYRKISTIMYTPDLEIFKNADVGFLMDIEEYFNGIVAINMDECISLISDSIGNRYFNETRKEIFERANREFFDSKPSDYLIIWHDILAL